MCSPDLMNRGQQRPPVNPTTVPQYGLSDVRQKLYPGEDKYFKENPQVAGMAAEDDKVILNPYSKLSDKEKAAVAQNESLRIAMRKQNIVPDFKLTNEQEKFFAGTEYAKAENEKRQTIVARILSGDPSAKATQEQRKVADEIMKRLGKTIQQPAQNYGSRPDGSKKGKGWMGELKRPDGGVSTELTAGVEFDGKQRDIPLIVPTLTKQEVDHLLRDGEPTDAIMKKAVEHARARIKQGKSPYAD